jgi:hypothetical protein
MVLRRTLFFSLSRGASQKRVAHLYFPWNGLLIEGANLIVDGALISVGPSYCRVEPRHRAGMSDDPDRRRGLSQVRVALRQRDAEPNIPFAAEDGAGARLYQWILARRSSHVAWLVAASSGPPKENHFKHAWAGVSPRGKTPALRPAADFAQWRVTRQDRLCEIR